MVSARFVISWTFITLRSAEDFVITTTWLMKGGTILRKACGKNTWRKHCKRVIPNEYAAKCCVFSIERIPLRNISAKYAAPHVDIIKMPADIGPKLKPNNNVSPKKIHKIYTSKGIPLITVMYTLAIIGNTKLFDIRNAASASPRSAASGTDATITCSVISDVLARIGRYLMKISHLKLI